jgi:hypothetical protein
LKRKIFSILVGAALFGLAQQGFAGAHEGAEPSCNDLTFGGQFAATFPNAKEYCLAVHDVDGELFAEFEGEIVRNRGGKVRAKFKHPNGSWGPVAEFQPDMSQRIKIGSRSYQLRDMQRGQQLNIMVPQDRFEVHVASDDDIGTAPAAVMPVAAMMAPSDAGGAMLPSTASPLVAIGLLGGLLVALGAGIGSLRRRLDA